MGIVPENATVDDVTAAQEKLLEAAERGQFRGFYGNEYYDELAAGDLVASVAWSGDVTQMQLSDNDAGPVRGPRSRAPCAGTTTCCIPKGAETSKQRTS